MIHKGNAYEYFRYVHEQAITTLAMVADASEGAFAKVSDQPFPNLSQGGS